MGDSDDSYDFAALEPFLEKLRAGFQLVMGNRFRGGIRPGAMPMLHRYLGNPVLSTIGRIFFGAPCRDFHCGLRGFDRQAILELDLQAPGMEFASEMVVKATLNKLRIAEVPTTLSPDGRGRPPHLRSWSDGWRHLRFLLLFSPRWLFLYPGLAMFVAGSLLMLWLLPGPRTVAGVTFDVHTLLYASLALVVGFQSVLFWMFATIYGMSEGIVPADPWRVSLAGVATLERGLKTTGVLLLIGLALGIYALGYWDAGGFGALRPSETMRLVIPSSTAILLAFECANGAFFVSVLEIRAMRRNPNDGLGSRSHCDSREIAVSRRPMARAGRRSVTTDVKNATVPFRRILGRQRRLAALSLSTPSVLVRRAGSKVRTPHSSSRAARLSFQSGMRGEP